MPKELPDGVLTLMFTDIVGSTAMADYLKHKHGDIIGSNIYVEKVRKPHDEIIRKCLDNHNGYEVKTIGDSFMAVFKQPHYAISAAADMIKKLEFEKIENPNPDDKNNPFLKIRIGLHTGTPHPDIVNGEVKDYIGHHVNLAARVEAIAADSQVLFSGIVKSNVGNLHPFTFYPWGDRRLKGISEPVEIFELQWDNRPLGPEPPHDKTFDYPAVYDLKDVIGRDGFIGDLKTQIKQHKLVTICGTGGVGKTAVAIKTCNGIPDDDYDKFFIALDNLNESSDETQIAGLIADSAGLPKDSGKSLKELTAAIQRECQKKPMLLLLDNYESLDSGKGRKVVAGLVKVDLLKILLTSRKAAGVVNIEKVKELKPFELKTDDMKKDELVKILKSSDSYKLLEARVRLQMENLEVTEADVEHVKSVLEMTCGLPLAIELVASNMNSYSWSETAESLQESFKLMGIDQNLCEGQPCPKRHLSMKACLNWSYNKLSEQAQRLFRALSLFANGFEVKLVDDCYSALFNINGRAESLRSLLVEIQKSSLISCINGRWSFLPIVHRHGKDLLNDDKNKPEIEAAFISYWDNFVEEYSSDDIKRMNNLKQLEHEHGHLTEFLNLLLDSETNHDRYIENTNNLSGFWYIERMWGDSIRYLEKAIEIATKKTEIDPDKYQSYVARSCNNLAVLLDDMGDLDGAKPLYNEALRLYKSLADKHLDVYLPYVALTCNNLAVLLRNMGDLDGAKPLYNEALRLYKSLADKHLDAYLPYVALTSNNLAALLSKMGDLDGAKPLYNEALQIRRSLAVKHPDAYLPYVATTCNNLALLLKNMGDFNGAKPLFDEALQIRRSIAIKHPDAYLPYVANTCNNLANLLDDMGDFNGAKTLYEEALGIRRPLADKYPAAYLNDLANVCHNYALLLEKMGDLDGAKKYYNEETAFMKRLKGMSNQ
ncbi:MAG: tetratricopeptide repeat protein [Nitrospirota bacterium]